MKPVFKNTPNICHKIDGKDIWISRSVAVVGCITIYYENNIFVLAEKRSSKMDMPGKWCLPCGYLDKKESGTEAVIREVYEETGLYLKDYTDNIYFDSLENPFKVSTNPTDFNENVTLCYGIDYELESLPNIKDYKTDKIEELKWILINDVDKYDWAFNHEFVIEKWLDFVSENS